MSYWADRAKMAVAAAPSTGTVFLSSAISPFQTFESAGVIDGQEVSYLIEEGPSWELGRGIYSSIDKSLTRGFISSSNGALIKFTGSSIVSIVMLSQDVASKTDIEAFQVLHGFVFPYEVALSYDKTTRKVTIAPTGATFTAWVGGVPFVKNGAQVSPAHTGTSGNYFLYYDTDGDMKWSSDPWDMKVVSPVCYVFYSATAADGIALFELHTYKRNPEWHESQHWALGTFVRSGLTVSGYTLNASTSNADVTYQIAGGVIVDEDIEYTLTTVSDGGPYTVLWRTGASEWQWSTNNTVPYLAGGTYIQYNQLSVGSYALTELNSGQLVNYYLFATSALEAAKRFYIIPGQAVFSTLAQAQAESVASLALGDFAIPESVAVWKFTYSALAGYVNVTGRVRLVEVNRITNAKGAINVSISTTTHNILTGRDAVDAHPASSVTFTPSGILSATNVQEAIAELAGIVAGLT